MLKFTTAAFMAAGLLLAAPQARALQVTVTQTDKNADGGMTYHFAVRTDAGETLSPGSQTVSPDFVTVYNFYGLVESSTKSPADWKFSSEEFGRTPMAGGYPMVTPLDVPNTPNLTWTVTKAIPPGTTVDGFTATTKVATSVEGEYSGQATRNAPAPKGMASSPLAADTKQAVLGTLPTPSFLAVVK